MYTLKIQKILNEVNRLQIPEEKVKLLCKAIQLADEHEDIEWAYDLRLQLLDIERDVAFSIESIPAFAWILQAYDENPDLFDENDFLWQYKWMLSDLYDNPEVSKSQLEAALTDFRTRLQRNGYGLRAYYNELLNDAVIQQDPLHLEKALQDVLSVDRDSMSDCEACEMDAEVTVTMYLKGFEQAHDKALPLLERQYTCAHVPMRTLVNLCYWAFKTGHTSVAAELLPKAETELHKFENDSSVLLSVAKLSVYIASVQPQRAIELIAQYSNLAYGPENRTSFLYALYTAEALGLLPVETIFNLHLSEQHPLFAVGKDQFELSELKAYYTTLAAKIAQKFDERNANTNFSKKLQRNFS